MRLFEFLLSENALQTSKQDLLLTRVKSRGSNMQRMMDMKTITDNQRALMQSNIKDKDNNRLLNMPAGEVTNLVLLAQNLRNSNLDPQSVTRLARVIDRQEKTKELRQKQSEKGQSKSNSFVSFLGSQKK